jgi:hypothetical protein
MEDILEVYARPYNQEFPVVCMDESSVQLIGEVRDPIPAAPGHPVLMDDEYVRNGVASIFLEVEPLGGKRKVKITEQRTRIDWAHFIKEMLEERYADAKKVVLVMDNLNTHDTASLYAAFPPEEARCLAERLEIHYTPKHGSWLNIAEIELSVLKRQCLAGRIDCIEKMRAEVAAWNTDRNNRHKEQLHRLESQLAMSNPARQLVHRRQLVGELAEKINVYTRMQIARKRREFEKGAVFLDAVSPLAVLGRGYAIVSRACGGRVIRSATQTGPGDRLHIRLHEGSLLSQVVESDG